MEEEYGSARQPVHTCSLRVAPAASGPLLLVCGARELPPEQAAAWAQGVLAALRPSAVALACTLPALSYRGPGDPADKDMVFSLQTSAAAAAAKTAASGSAAQLPLPLPDATMLGGLPAALLAACELRGLPAAAAAGVQAQQVPDAQFLFALGQGAQATLRSALGGPQQAQQEAGGRAQLVAALGAAADAVYRSSASSSIFS